MDRKDAMRVVAMLKAAYPASKWGEDDELTFDVWQMALHDVPAQYVIQTLPGLMRTSIFAPSPAEVLSAVFAASGVGPEPEVAWGHVQSWLRKHTEYSALPAPIKAAINDIGGTYNLRNSERPGNDRKAFMDAYAVRRNEAITSPDFSAMIGAGFMALGAG